MPRVACYCGDTFAFDGTAGDCPRCGTLATLPALSATGSASPAWLIRLHAEPASGRLGREDPVKEPGSGAGQER